MSMLDFMNSEEAVAETWFCHHAVFNMRLSQKAPSGRQSWRKSGRHWRITGSLSAPQTANGPPWSLWQQPRALEGPQTGASEQMPIINVAIWRCQSCQSALHGDRPSPRPVRGPEGWTDRVSGSHGWLRTRLRLILTCVRPKDTEGPFQKSP
ncbi:unnamed protein product [Pleuronectes platessa]|uniref:Uncharacterized protein n=1 Tax=Pleuronectes platessa TaxID=8262 RepID=A0A9N7V0A8_PLEPL|nr:unnamed protein product [Pleuronectes platessa]